jgi:rhodanese-related sulfurtransferase
MNTITREQLETEIANPELVLLEALPEQYFKSGHLPRARWFPTQQARELAQSVAPTRDAPIVVYCASDTCKNSHQVAKLLEDAGYTRVRVYVGGKADWQAAGLPVEV